MDRVSASSVEVKTEKVHSGTDTACASYVKRQGGHMSVPSGHVTESGHGTGQRRHVTDMMVEAGVLITLPKPPEVVISRTPFQYDSPITTLSSHGSEVSSVLSELLSFTGEGCTEKACHKIQEAISMGNRAECVTGSDLDLIPLLYENNKLQVAHEPLPSSGAVSEVYSHLVPEGITSLPPALAQSWPPCEGDLHDDKEISDSHEESEERPWKTPDEYGTQESDGDVEGDRMVVRAGVLVDTREYNKSQSATSNSSERSGRSVTSEGSGKHLIPTSGSDWLVNSLYERQPFKENSIPSLPLVNFCECKKFKAENQSRLRKTELLAESRADQLATLRKRIELISKDPVANENSYFEEIVNLVTELSGRQEEIEEMKVQLEGYGELKCRLEHLERQARGGAEHKMELQKEDTDLKELLSQTECGSDGVSLHQNSSEMVQLESIERSYGSLKKEQDEMIARHKRQLLSLTNEIRAKDAKLRELEARLDEGVSRERSGVVAQGGMVKDVLVELRSKVVSLEGALERKDGLVLKLKERLKDMTVPISDLEGAGQSLHPRDLVSRSHPQESELVFAEVQRQHADDAKRVEELEVLLGALGKEVADRDAQLLTTQRKCDKVVKNYMRINEHGRKATEALEAREAEHKAKVEYLSADIAALNRSLVDSGSQRMRFARQLQEAEKERADLEVKAGRLELGVAERNALIENQSKELTGGRKKLMELRAEMELMKEEMKAEMTGRRDLQEELILHQTRATIFEQDFKQERSDRETAHSKHTESQEHYKHQLDSLAKECQNIMDEREVDKKRMMELEASHKVQLSRMNYALGERKTKLATQEEERKALEVNNVTMMQQLKQNKKQTYYLKNELTAMEAKVKLLEKTAAEKEIFERQLHVLQRENIHLKARAAHQDATAGSGGKAGVLSSVNDKKRIAELEETVEVLQVERACLKSQIEDPSYSKATPSLTQAPPIFSTATSSSMPREKRDQKFMALPTRPSIMNMPTKTVDNHFVLQSRGNNGRGNQEQAQSKLPPLHPNNGGHLAQIPESQRPHTSFHVLPGRARPQASNADHPGATPSSNMNMGTNSSIRPLNVGVISDYPNMAMGDASASNSVPRYNIPTCTPSYQHQRISAKQPSQGPYGYPTNLPPTSSSVRQSQPYLSGHNGGMSGPCSLPGNLPPPPPQIAQGQVQSQDPSLRQNHVSLRQGALSQGGSGSGREDENVEKDSPPSSMSRVSPGTGPPSLQCVNLPANPNNSSQDRKCGSQLPPACQQRSDLGKKQPELNVAGLGGHGLGRGQLRYHHGMQSGANVMANSNTAIPHSEGKSNPLQEITTSTSFYSKIEHESGLAGLSRNRLEMDIDFDIVTAADALKYRASGATHGGASSDNAPYDPNLECPTCGLRFRIGRIQNFREHASSCLRKTI